MRRRTVRKYGRGITRPYVNKRNRLILGAGRKKRIRKQRGGFLPLISAIAPTALEILSKVI